MSEHAGPSRWDRRDQKRRRKMKVDSKSVFTIERLQRERAAGLRAVAVPKAKRKR